MESVENLAVNSAEQAHALLALPESQMLGQANRLREAAFGRTVDLCAIINAKSGNCGMDCRFCSQSSHNSTPIRVFAFLPEDVLRKRILALLATPVNHVGVVVSGAALGQDGLQRLASVLDSLPGDLRGRVCGSLGRLGAEPLARLHAHGMRRYHHNLETARTYYPRICTSQQWDERRDTVLRARTAGLEPCCGGLFGLGESWDERISFAFSLKELGVAHIPINFLHPHPQTPLARRPLLEAGEALRIIALFRHILPTATLRICGGRPETLGPRQGEMFHAGANALMTGDYLTTQGAALEQDLAMIAAAGMEVASRG